jgi:cytoskeletal protein CcmA (bactofilin family)
MSETYDELKRAEHSRHGGNIVGAGLVIKGAISGQEDLLVDGIVDGPIQLGEGILTIGAKGQISSDVAAREITVYGIVKGNLNGRDRIEIKKEGSVIGNLTTGRIVIEDGATVKGSIEIVRPHRNPTQLPRHLPPNKSEPQRLSLGSPECLRSVLYFTDWLPEQAQRLFRSAPADSGVQNTRERYSEFRWRHLPLQSRVRNDLRPT